MSATYTGQIPIKYWYWTLRRAKDPTEWHAALHYLSGDVLLPHVGVLGAVMDALLFCADCADILASS